jgi:hypothetical protein
MKMGRFTKSSATIAKRTMLYVMNAIMNITATIIRISVAQIATGSFVSKTGCYPQECRKNTAFHPFPLLFRDFVRCAGTTLNRAEHKKTEGDWPSVFPVRWIF